MKTLTPNQINTLLIDTITDWMVEKECHLYTWEKSYEARFNKLDKDGCKYWSLFEEHLTILFDLVELRKIAVAKARKRKKHYLPEWEEQYNECTGEITLIEDC